jgi:transcriptional regulator with XRE-family HTH domain
MRKLSGPLIQAAREQFGETRDQTAAGVGKSYPTIQQYELGIIAPPANVLAALADRYGVPVDSFYAEANDLAGAR